MVWIVNNDPGDTFGNTAAVNDSAHVGNFLTVLTGNSGSVLITTATNPMVSSADDGVLVQCAGGTLNDYLTIDVAGIVHEFEVLDSCSELEGEWGEVWDRRKV